MNSKFQRSGVLTSTVDYFCLVCECRLHNETDATTHIVKPVHNKNLNTTEYFENQEDCVRKIKKWYFCELCNLLLATAKRVHLHINELKHIEYRNNQILHRNGKFVIVFSKVQIPDITWNGIIEDACVICNVEFENLNIHMNESAHIIKLIQSRVDTDACQNIYRKIDESFVQCLTCNTIVALSTINAHFDQAEHKKLYQEACVSAENVISPKDEKTDTNKDDNVNNNSQNKKSEEEKCQAANTITENNVSKKEVNNVVKAPSLKPIKAPPKSDKEICEVLNAKNYLTEDEQGRPWCIVCNWVIESLEIYEHISDIHHKTMVKLHKKRLSKLNADQNALNINIDKIGHADNKDQENVKQGHDILDSIENFQNNSIKINLEIQSAYCNKCSISLEFNKEVIENHIKEHPKCQKSEKKESDSTQLALATDEGKSKSEVLDKVSLNDEEKSKSEVLDKVSLNDEEKSKSEVPNKVSLNELITSKKKIKYKQSAIDTEETIKQIAEKNNMIYKPNNNQVYCNSCNVKIAPMIKNLKEHVAGSNHKSKVAKQNMSCIKNSSMSKDDPIDEVNLIKVPITTFITSTVTVDTSKFKDILINMNICINIFSFVLMMKTGNMIACHVCKTIENIKGFRQHMNLAKHEKIIHNSNIVVLENEFIREVQPDCFHCGYCNILFYSWCDTQKHLNTVAHRENKTSALWRLEQYKPRVVNNKFVNSDQFSVEPLFGEVNEDF